MGKMKKSVLLLISLLLVFELSSQINKYGTPIIKNYSALVTLGTEYNWSITKDKSGVVYFGNDINGIIRYDGHSWSIIPVRNDPVIRTLGCDSSGVIYVGGSFEFGYLKPDPKGHINYVSISKRFEESDTLNNKNTKETGETKSVSSSSDSLGFNNVVKRQVNIGEIVSMVVTDSVVYFGSYESLFIYNIAKDSVEYINLRKAGLKKVIKVARVGSRIFLADNISGLFELKNGKPELLKGGEFFKMKICIVLLPFDSTRMFIGTHTNGVFLFDYNTGNISSDFISPSLNEELKSAMIYTALGLPTGELILGTLKEGIFVLSGNGQLLSVWNKETTDMQDNTVTALYTGEGNNSELWISSAGYLSKAYINMPFTEFSQRSGFEGIINNIAEFDNNVFVSTDLGLFKSKITGTGLIGFEKYQGINNQVFVISNAENGSEKSLLVGSNMGLYHILENGTFYRVDNVIKIDHESKRSFYSGLSVRSITQSKISPERFYIGYSTRGLAVIEYTNRTWRHIRSVKSLLQGSVTGMIEDEKGDLMIYTGNPVGLYHLALNDTITVQFDANSGLPEATINSISKIGKKIVAATGQGLYRYESEKKLWIPCNELTDGYTAGKMCKDLVADKDGDLWLSFSGDREYDMMFRNENDKKVFFKGSLNILPNLYRQDFKYFDERYWMAKSKNIYIIDKQKLLYPSPGIQTLLSKIVIGNDSLLMNGTFFYTLQNGRRVPAGAQKDTYIPEIKYIFNSISFFWTLPYFVDEESTLYSYKLEGFAKEWSRWEPLYYKDFTNLPYGRYTFRVKAKTATEIESGEAVYEFYILKPWYLTTLMIILYAIVAGFIVFAIIMAYTKKLKNENIRLEGIVAERTAVVVKQKEELESSIHYASRIQMALLPSEAILSENLKNYFILFKPRDIVSGDFYWMTKKNNRLYVVAADCTGHGVPGAFMSLLGMSFLDEIIDKESSIRADHILSELRLHVTESLKQVGQDNEAKDGMDMALLVIDYNSLRVEFSGAYNPCFRVRKMNEEEAENFHDENMEMPDGSMSDGKYLLETIFASKMPIGISSRMNENFVFSDWILERGVSYYLFSDGYIDQFGGPDNRKFMKKNFKRFILEIQVYPMDKQKELLEQNLNSWMEQSPQIDDILVMGIRT
jgi:serine phosphatase RsbU (regulator of sigma subunit)